MSFLGPRQISSSISSADRSWNLVEPAPSHPAVPEQVVDEVTSCVMRGNSLSGNSQRGLAGSRNPLRASPRSPQHAATVRRPIPAPARRSFVVAASGSSSSNALLNRKEEPPTVHHPAPPTSHASLTPPARPLSLPTSVTAAESMVGAPVTPPVRLEPLTRDERRRGSFRSSAPLHMPLPAVPAYGMCEAALLPHECETEGSVTDSAIVPVPGLSQPTSSSPVGSALMFARQRSEHGVGSRQKPSESAGVVDVSYVIEGDDDDDDSRTEQRRHGVCSMSESLTPPTPSFSRQRSPRAYSGRVALSSPTGANDDAAARRSTNFSVTNSASRARLSAAGAMTPFGGSMSGSSAASFGYSTTSPMPSLGMRQYTVDRRKPLGAGASGTVYSGFDTIRGDHVAVKMAHVGGAAAEQASAEFEAEFRTLTQLAHENIVGVRHLELVPERGEAAIVMEWVPGGSIASALERQRFRLHELVVRRYLREALLGVEYLHANGVLHRDLKPANLLLSGAGGVKVSDFGTSRILGGGGGGVDAALANATQNTKTVVGTPAYMAPELISAGKCSRAVDIWALAATAVEMLSGKAPWSHLPRHKRQPVPLMFHIGMAQPPEHHPRIPPHVSPPLRALLERCFSFKPRKRPSAAELLRDEYFSLEQAIQASAVAAAEHNEIVVALPPVSPDAVAAQLGMEDIGAYADARQEFENGAATLTDDGEEETDSDGSDEDDF